MTVEELIARLKTFPPTAKVGRIGHFGEFHEMHLTDFYMRKVEFEYKGYRFEPCKPYQVLNIDPPDIGPDPD